ncbi:hypothetical protein [Neobacillus drentensis]|uniref:hypothetical protein n=1 Tax=Neobacillus drentensis TaxID=220684 RepID=UPI00285C060F|nr:hypothetical protein [Neobacillus drentensis]MDR7240888.1 putative Zn ribbon protein [Neobacillus drentensis]
MGNYRNKVAWCPICSQGWVEIVKDVETNELFVMCDECENEWNNPTEIKSQKARTEINDNRVTIPTDEEIRSVKWEKYIIND